MQRLYPAHTAILSMDCQAAIVSYYLKGAADEFLKRASSVLSAARGAGAAVIHVQVGFRPGLPEVSSRNKLFAGIKSSPQRQQMFQGAAGAIHPAIAPEPGEVVITKHRISAFSGTDLDMILRAKDIDTLVLSGIATSGVVLSTLLDASDADYRPIVLSDCCADDVPELHSVLINRLFPQRGEVAIAAEFITALKP
jgi:nicotinamidase-related amidase